MFLQSCIFLQYFLLAKNEMSCIRIKIDYKYKMYHVVVF